MRQQGPDSKLGPDAGAPLETCHPDAPPHDLRMTIGIPKEIKIGETRVSMTPSLCRRCVALGAEVIVEKSAGISSGFTDPEYRAAGARLASSAAKVWAAADLILKVKEPLPSEYGRMRGEQAL